MHSTHQEQLDEMATFDVSPGQLHISSLQLPLSYPHLEFVQQDLKVDENETQTKVKKIKDQKFPMMQRY